MRSRSKPGEPGTTSRAYEDQPAGIVLYPNWRREVKLARSARARERARHEARLDRPLVRRGLTA
jgi:hypothetical protein